MTNPCGTNEIVSCHLNGNPQMRGACELFEALFRDTGRHGSAVKF